MESSVCIGASRSEIQDDYFHWLCGIVHGDDPDCSFELFLWVLYSSQFYWFVNNDGNRAADGMDLREEFKTKRSYSNYSSIEGPCTVLEMLIGLALRIDGEIMWNPSKGNRTVSWFWEMIRNLKLGGFDDEHIDVRDVPYIERKLDIFMKRNYSERGKGGLFPLKKGCEDQRNVEIWYQMNSYFEETYGVEEDF